MTLAIDPGVAADVGWQLSFAAVLGIFLLAAPLRGAIAARLGPGGWRRALAEGAAVTIAATLATAPLIAFHFETLSTTTLLANLLAMPAVAPAMWLGMVERRRLPGPRPAGRGARTASTPCCSPTSPRSPPGAGGRAGRRSTSGSAPAGLARLLSRRWRRGRVAAAPGRRRRLLARGGRAAGRRPARQARRRRRSAVAAGARRSRAWRPGAALVLARRRRRRGRPGSGLRVEVLDVGQGDAILLQPADAPAVLVDGGPPGDDLVAKLEEAGVERLGAAVVTHDQSDHVGGVEELLGRFPIARLVYARLGRGSRSRGAGRGRRRRPRSRPGGELRSGRAAPARCSGRRRELLADAARRRRPERSWRWSCSPAGATSRCC